MMTSDNQSLWRVKDGSRCFLIPNDQNPETGDALITTLGGGERSVNLESLTRFEVTEKEARRWAKEELGDTLDQLKHNIDEKLADWQRQLDDFKKTPVTKNSSVTPEAGSTFFDFLAQLPQIVSDSVSGDKERVDSARKATAELERRFNESGLPVDERLRNFPDRMAKIHESGPTTKK